MAKQSCFTSKAELFVAILPEKLLKNICFIEVWNTSDGSLLAEWKHLVEDSDVQFSCIASSFVGGKKRRQETGTCLVALGTDAGEVFTIDARNAELKWKSSGHHNGKIAALSFANEGRKLCVISTVGTTCEMNSETGELLKEMKIPKKYISSSVYIFDDVVVAAVNTKIRVFNLEDGEELLKISTDTGPVQHMSMLEDKKVIITSGLNEKNLKVWKNDSSTKTVTSGPVLSMRHPPLAIECKNGNNGDNIVVLSVSESGVAYIWNLKTLSEGDIVPTKIEVEANKPENDLNASGKKPKKRHNSILAASLNSIDGDDQVSVCIAYGSLNSPQFALMEVTSPGEDIVVDATGDIQKNDGKDQKSLRSKKRAASDADSENTRVNLDNDLGDPMDGVQIDYDSNEPTMGEKLAILNIINNEDRSEKKPETAPTKPPSADSVHVLLKQALHADDRSVADSGIRKRVIANSVALLNPSDVFKLLESLISMIQLRGAVVACALPWLKSLLLQHASSVISQESSLIALNSLYQLIESRISTFNSTLQLSSCVDLLFSNTIDGVDEPGVPLEPIIYEDVSDDDESEEEEEDDGEAMETDEEDEELEAVSTVSDLEGSDGMVDY